MNRKCSICLRTSGTLLRVSGSLRSLGYPGNYAHAECLAQARSRRQQSVEKRAIEGALTFATLRTALRLVDTFFPQFSGGISNAFEREYMEALRRVREGPTGQKPQRDGIRELKL